MKAPDTITVTTEEEVTITCVIEGLPPPTPKWTKGTEKKSPVKPGDKYKVDHKDDKVTLTIYNTQPDDADTYTLTIENPVGKDSKNIPVKVESK